MLRYYYIYEGGIAMKKDKKALIYIFGAVALLLAVVGGICLYLALAGQFDNEMGHFEKGSVLAAVVYICMIVGAAVGVAPWVIYSDRAAEDMEYRGGIAYKIVSYLAAAAMLFDLYFEARNSLYTNAQKGNLFFTVSLIFEFFTVAYLLASPTLNKKGKRVSGIMSLFSFSPVIFCAFRVLYMYFDPSVAVNSPVKLFCQLSYIALMLVFCAETGLSLGRGNIYARYIFTLLTAITVCGTVSIGAAAAFVSGIEVSMLIGTDILLKLFLFLYCIVELIAVAGIETREKIKVAKK